MRKDNEFKSESNDPENFWPKILTLLCIGAFIYWVMTSENADKTIDQYLFDLILILFDTIKINEFFVNDLETYFKLKIKMDFCDLIGCHWCGILSKECDLLSN